MGTFPEENICLLSVSNAGAARSFVSNRIQSLLWGFSAGPSLLLFDLKLFCALRGRIDVSESKFRTKKFSWFKFSHLGVLCEICEILHHTKISGSYKQWTRGPGTRGPGDGDPRTRGPEDPKTRDLRT